jgi:hypothetical protein
VREITLIGQNVNAFHGEGPDGQRSWPLGRLLHHLAAIPGVARLRYTTSHPRDVDDSLIEAHRDLPALMPFVHLPVQSGSDRILAAMNRKHTAADYLRIVERFRDAAPDIVFSSDFIVGFPGETEEDFEATLALVTQIGYAGAYSFKYSPRPGTPAAELEQTVPTHVMDERLARLQAADRPPAGGLQSRRLHRQDGRRAVRSARAQGGPDRRPLAVSAAGACDGLARHHRAGSAGASTRLERYSLIGELSLAGPRRIADAAKSGRKRLFPSATTTEPETLARKAHRIRRNDARPQTQATATFSLPPTPSIVVAFDDNRAASALVGPYGQNLALIERRLGVVADSRGNHITLAGSRDGCDAARRVLEMLYEQASAGPGHRAGRCRGRDPRRDRARLAVRISIPRPRNRQFEEINLRKRPVRARTAAQDSATSAR